MLSLCLALIAVLAVALRLGVLACHAAGHRCRLVLFVTGAAILSPQNGLVLLFTLPAVFNGEDSQPYFFLLEIFVYVTLAAGVIRYVLERRPLKVPYAPLVFLLALSTVISFPLNLKELWLEADILSWREIVEEVRRSTPRLNFFHVRTVLNMLSGVGLYVLVVNQRGPDPGSGLSRMGEEGGDRGHPSKPCRIDAWCEPHPQAGRLGGRHGGAVETSPAPYADRQGHVRGVPRLV